MGGKGDDNSSSSSTFQATTAAPTEGGWTYRDTGTMERPEVPEKEEEETETEAPITEDPTETTGVEAVEVETQPYAPPGFGNYPEEATNLSPLGDVLVTGMKAEPGKKGPAIPLGGGQV